ILEEDAVRNIVQQCLEDISLAGQGLPCALVLGNLLAQGLVYLGQVAGPLLNELLQFLSKLLRPFFHCLVVNTARHIRGARVFDFRGKRNCGAWFVCDLGHISARSSSCRGELASRQPVCSFLCRGSRSGCRAFKKSFRCVTIETTIREGRIHRDTPYPSSFGRRPDTKTFGRRG